MAKNQGNKLIIGLLSLLLYSSLSNADDHEMQTNFTQQLSELEHSYGGRLGVAVLDTDASASTTPLLHYRGNERFAMCSTFKFFLVAAVLARVDKHQESLNRIVHYDAKDVLDYAPITRKNLNGDSGEMTVSELASAAIEFSDNTAANLMMIRLGGPKGLTHFLRKLGDKTTRLDNIEPFLNDNAPQDLKDTTTPKAMVYLMNKILVGNSLSAKSKDQLISWMMKNTTGTNKLRAGLPTHWMIGDKTGTCGTASNDIAIIWPDADKPIMVAVYYSNSTQPLDTKNHVIESVGKIVSQLFSGH